MSDPLEPPPELVATRLLQFRVLLSCSCGHDTDRTFDAGAIGLTGRSYTCEGCRASHWFNARMTTADTGEGDGG